MRKQQNNWGIFQNYNFGKLLFTYKFFSLFNGVNKLLIII